MHSFTPLKQSWGGMAPTPLYCIVITAHCAPVSAKPCFACRRRFPCFVTSQQCTQYHLQGNDPCSPHLTSCHYVTTPTSLSLSATDNQLGDLLGQVRPALTNGALRRECLDAFLSLYCLQAYRVCGRLVGGVFETVEGAVCPEDCVGVVSGVCGREEWSYLTNVVQELRGSGIVDLPPLVQLQDCGSDVQQPCLAITQQSKEYYQWSKNGGEGGGGQGGLAPPTLA